MRNYIRYLARRCFLLMLSLIIAKAWAQTINYTHKTSKLASYDGAIVVPDIGGMHHLLIFSPGATTKLQVYTDQLEWHSETVLPVKLYHTSHVTILPLQNEYFLYNPSPPEFGLWRIDALGKAHEETIKLKEIKRKFFADTSASCQMYSYHNRMYVAGNVYMPAARKIVITIIELNSLLEPGPIKEYTCDYDHRRERLQLITLVPESDLIIMKKYAESTGKYILQIMKIKLQTAKVYKATYTEPLPFSSPNMFYNATDSSLTVYSRTRIQYRAYADTLKEDIFHTTANDTLATLYPSTITRVTLLSKTYPYFLAFQSGNEFTHWLRLAGNWNDVSRGRSGIGLPQKVSAQANEITFLNASSYNPVMQPIDPYLQSAAYPAHVRFIVIDKNFNIVDDTTVRHLNKNFIEVSQYATFSNENRNYLLLKEQFHSRGKGLLLMSVSIDGKLIAEKLHPYERFHYTLPQMQRSSKGHIFIPFITKGKVGLVQINLNKAQ